MKPEASQRWLTPEDELIQIYQRSDMEISTLQFLRLIDGKSG